MRGEHLLTVPGTLHSPQNALEIAPDPPFTGRGLLGEAHFLERNQPGSDVLLANLRELAAGGAVHVPANTEVSGVIGPVDLPGPVRPVNHTVQRRIPALLNLAPFGRHRVHLVPMPNLARAEILGNGPYPVTDVLTVQIKRRSVSFDPAHGDMDVRVFGIEMWYSKPLQSRVQIFLHFAHEIAGQSVQVDAFAEFRRNDHFPEPRVACLLPAIEDLRRRKDFALVANGGDFVALHHTVSGDVAAVCAPLSGGPVWRVHHANRASLVELPPPSTRSAVGTAFLPAPRASGVANNRPHTGRPGKRFVFAGRSGTPGPNPELPLAFSFRGHGLTTLPWRLGNRPPLPCLRS